MRRRFSLPRARPRSSASANAGSLFRRSMVLVETPNHAATSLSVGCSAESFSNAAKSISTRVPRSAIFQRHLPRRTIVPVRFRHDGCPALLFAGRTGQLRPTRRFTSPAAISAAHFDGLSHGFKLRLTEPGLVAPLPLGIAARIGCRFPIPFLPEVVLEDLHEPSKRTRAMFLEWLQPTPVVEVVQSLDHLPLVG